MHISPWQFAVEFTAMFLQIAVVAILLRTRLGRAWPSLIAILTIDVLSSAAMLWLVRNPAAHYALYFYTYWIAAGVQSLVRIWIAVDVCRSFRFIEYLPSWIYFSTGCLALAMALACGYASWHPGAGRLTISQTVILLDQSVSIAWAGFFLTLLVSIRVTGIHWQRLGAQITAGVLVLVAANVATSEVLTRRTAISRLVAGNVEALAEIAVLIFWGVAILQDSKSPDSSER